MKFCNYCKKLIPQGYDLWWNQKPYHPDCCIQVAITDTKGTEDMDCKYCNTHILATTSVHWKGNPYHEQCLARAIDEYYEPPKEELNQAAEFMDDFNHDEMFDGEDDFADDELAQAFEAQEPEYANGVAEVSEQTVVVTPEVMTHSPAGNGREVHINEIVANVSRDFAQSKGTLMLGTKGSRYVSRSELFDLETPPATSTWQPVAHHDFVRRLLDGLWDRRMSVLDEKYAVSADGFKLYGLITLYDEYAGVNYAVGLRNSNDKSTRLSLAVGYVVKVCTNGMVSGDYQPLMAKHTAKFNLDDSLALGIDRIKRSFLSLSGTIDRKREIALTEGKAQELVYKAFMQYKLPVSLLNTVHKELFVSPSHEEFKPLNIWSLENSFTTAFKKLQPTSQFEATAKLAKFIDSTLN
jgi:hypothetical protein